MPIKKPAADLPANRLSIVYKPLSQINLLPEETNPNVHAEQEIIDSINEFGMIDPIAINGTTANDFDGNGRAKMLRKMKDGGLPCPKYCYVDEKTNEWLVPTIEGVEMDLFTEARAALALNTTNRKGFYDETRLAQLLQNIVQNSGEESLAATGFSSDDLTALLLKANQTIQPNNAGKTQSNFAASHVRMCQLFLNADNQPVFLSRVDALIRTNKFFYQEKPVDNLTDLVFSVIEEAARQHKIKIEGLE